VEGRRAEEKKQAMKLLAKRRKGRDAANEGETPSVRGSRKRPIGQGGGLEAKTGEVTEARRGSTGEERVKRRRGGRGRSPLFCRTTMNSAYSLDVRTSRVARRWTAQRRARGDSPYSRRDALPSQLLGRGTGVFGAARRKTMCRP